MIPTDLQDPMAIALIVLVVGYIVFALAGAGMSASSNPVVRAIGKRLEALALDMKKLRKGD